MASAKSVAIRQELATARIEAALKALHVRVGDGLTSPVSDPEVRQANILESIAGALERAVGKAAPAPIEEPSEETIVLDDAALEPEPSADPVAVKKGKKE